ncbi:MAG: NIPSNAP family protein [Candidatus Solibacter sp.]
MHRRSFVGLMAAAGGAQVSLGQSAPARKTQVFVQQNYLLKAGSQGTRLTDYLSKAYLPALAKVHTGPTLVLEATLAPHLPQVTVLTGYQSVEEMWSLRAKVDGDKALEAATDAWETEAPFENITSSLLRVGDYSPELAPLNPQPTAPRVFEMRIYHAPTWKNMRGLEWRFREGEVSILTKIGATPILFAPTVIGDDVPNMTWITAFENEAARDKAWAAFGADPDWQKLSAESRQRYGDNPTSRQIRLYRAAAYSPIR